MAIVLDRGALGSFGPFPGMASLPDRRRLAVAVLLSLLFHLFLMFGVGFKLPDPSRFADTAPPLDVILVNTRSQERPRQPTALAQVNTAGGGDTAAKVRATSPLPVTARNDPQVTLEQKSRKVQQLEQEAKRLMTRVKQAEAALPPPTRVEQKEEQADAPDAGELMRRAMQMVRLQAQIDKDFQAYQARPRRREFGVNAVGYKYARYVEDWRMKVERVGNLNYPEEARRNKIFGDLQLTVYVKSDGSIEKVEMNRSSGHKVLDQAALRIVELSSPYAPFPDEIRKETDILGITRTWIFTRTDQLISQ